MKTPKPDPPPPPDCAPSRATEATALDTAIAETRAWVERVVIGLNLCPFAKAAQAGGRTRFVGSTASDARTLLAAFCAEVRFLAGASAADVETTLLVHPYVLADFDDYNAFLDVADAALQALGCAGVLQVASFHPRYRFAGTEADDIGNATNRSPYPVLQLLREDSIEQAIAAYGDTAAIYAANMRTLETIGAPGWAELQASCRRDAAAMPRLP